MKRRSFIKKAALAGAASTFPYILPSGRLFAKTNAELAEHVVYVLFAGGVRQQEAVLQRYLSDSQGLNIEGNIMYNMLNGSNPDRKIVYGTTPSGDPDGSLPIPQLLSSTLQSQGLLMPEVEAVNGGHYGGLTSLLTGNRATAQGLKVRPIYPTIFEYLRRHRGFKASDAWFVGSGIGNSFPLLNSSNHPNYGTGYGANFVAPSITFGSEGEDVLSNAKIYHPLEELEPTAKMRAFLNNSFRIKNGDVDGIRNDEGEKADIKTFIRDMFNKKQSNSIAAPPISDNSDLRTVGHAAEVLKYFKPKILVVNLTAVDGCHANFTGYLKSLHRADHAVGWLWNYIQTEIPQMAGNTILMTSPECGRNEKPNPIQDSNDWYAFDHSGDYNTSRVFTMMAGPNVPQNMILGADGNRIGRTTDNVLTIAEIFGIKDAVKASGLIDPAARSIFDQL
ncbi:MAG: hypothetical protein ACI8ZN_002561 [Bacteroidia bacterium]|jgi:hypothetical protein